MPFKCEVTADKRMIFSGTSRLKFWRKDQWGDWEYLEEEFINYMGFEWLGYDGEEGRQLWGGPVWTDGNLYWTFSAYALRSFLEDLREDKKVQCELSEWNSYVPGVRWVFTNKYDAEYWLRQYLVYEGFLGIYGDDALDLAQKLSDYEFELDPMNQLHETDGG